MHIDYYSSSMHESNTDRINIGLILNQSLKSRKYMPVALSLCVVIDYWKMYNNANWHKRREKINIDGCAQS